MSNVRTETDTFGPIEVAADRYWGAQAQRSLVQKVYGAMNGGAPDFDAWRDAHSIAFARARKSLDEILTGGELTLAQLTVAVAHLRDLAQEE